ncbi:MAG: Ig-like domain-containing protein [Gammaproteobacteria bacterium]
MEDTAGNALPGVARAYEFAIQPDVPTIADYPLSPAITRLASRSVTLEGTRNDNTSIWINEQEVVAHGSGAWSATVALAEGQNNLSIHAQDAQGNPSAAVTALLFVDSIAAVVRSISPPDGTHTQDIPSEISAVFTEAGTGIDVANSTLSVTRAGVAVAGVRVATGNRYVFTPDIPFREGEYQFSLQLVDLAGNASTPRVATLVFDRTAPGAPALDGIPEVTNISTLDITGTKEAWGEVQLNGRQVVGRTDAGTWRYKLSLVDGRNELSFTVRDRAGNESPPTSATIVFDDTAPGPVALTADGVGDGTSVALDWTGYDEVANGADISNYTVYIAASAFTSVAAATPTATVAAGVKRHAVEDLTRERAYHFAVVARDTKGNALTEVSSVSATTADQQPPAEVTQLSVQSFADRLLATWGLPDDPDLAAIKFIGDAKTISLPASDTQHELTGLDAASAYPIRVTTVDRDDNESAGVALTGVTWLANPAIANTQALSGMVELNWSAATPPEYVKHYAIYVAQSDFTSVQGLTPARTVTPDNTSARIAGLTNDTAYAFAITAVNLSDGEQPNVVTVSETPQPDEAGPAITNTRYRGAALAEGSTVTQAGVISLDASDATGVGSVEFAVDDKLLARDVNSADGYSAYWELANTADGAHTLRLSAEDTLGNRTDEAINVTVALQAPAAPGITSPTDGHTTSQSPIVVDGRADALSDEVVFYVDGQQLEDAASVGADGRYSHGLQLQAGENRIQAAARNRGGLSALSPAVVVTLDTSVPDTPSGLSARARDGGEISLTWRALEEGAAAGYHLYRAAASFTAIEQASRVNTHLITGNRFDDLLPEDGAFFYRITAVNAAGTQSGLSNEASASADSTPPRAVSIAYASSGPVDPQSGRMGPGEVQVTVTVNEPLLTTPFLSLTPDAGVPISVGLSRDTDTVYRGAFTITDLTPSGTSYAVFSARDASNNRGTEIDVGRTIEIDTDGPAVSGLLIAPAHPIKTDQANPTAVSAELTLSEAVKAGGVVQLAYLLSAAGRVETPVDTLEQTGDLIWRARFTLPADAGLSEPELLSLRFSAPDDLDNIGTEIRQAPPLQVYQGDLPPVDVPQGLSAQALPGGQIKLSWEAVQGANDYQLYRQGPGEVQLVDLVRSGNVLELSDETTLDGAYQYAIASIRQHEGENALSAMSPPVAVSSDARAPLPPTGLALELVGAGILAQWVAPEVDGEEIHYALYRSSAAQITSIDGLEPVVTDIGEPRALDPRPSNDAHTYAVTAIDAAGNESAPSASAYLNFDLLPVATLNVTQTDLEAPVVQWTHPAGNNLAGYDLYLGPRDGGLALNEELLTDNSYTDVGYAADERHYTIVAVDTNGVESAPRSLTLPHIAFSPGEEAALRRGVMNRLSYEVAHHGHTPAQDLILTAEIGDHVHHSAPFTLLPEEQRTVEVIVGGHAELPDLASLKTTLALTPASGEQARVVRTGNIAVGDGGLVLRLTTEDFTRGATGRAQLRLENTSAVEIELLTALKSGKQPSPELRLVLVDADGNVLATQSAQQYLGDGVISLADGRSVVRIAPGSTFTLSPIEIAVPAGAPESVNLRAEIDRVHYHLGRDDHVAIGGLSSSRTVALVDTAYYGEVASISPQASFGDQPVVITGRAVERTSGTPQAGVALNVVITANGFERQHEALSDEAGQFSYRFEPLSGEAGIYTVAAVHPAVQDRPEQGRFTISRILISPAVVDLRLPYGQSHTLEFTVTAGEGTNASGVRLVPAVQAAPGLAITLGASVDLAPGQSARLPLTLQADETASDQTLTYHLRSNESGERALGEVRIDARFAAALPAVFYTPSFIETGVARADHVRETLKVENRGLTDLSDLTLDLVTETGSAAPPWVYLTSPREQGDVAVGDARTIELVASPDAAVAEGVHLFKLRLSSENHPQREVTVAVAVTQSGIGNALFKLSDIYTATLDPSGKPIAGLAGARLRIRNEAVANITRTLSSDALGEVLFEDLPAGRYTYRATATNHKETTGRFTVKPGITASEAVFLSYNLISVEWSVREITLEDRYEINLRSTFETDVPAAVVVAQPTSVNLPTLRPGDVFHGEFTLTNHGLIRADEVRIELPPQDQYFRYELISGLPERIEAQSTLSVPYRAVMLRPFEPDGSASGGGCYTYQPCASVRYAYTCANGYIDDNKTGLCWFYNYGQCSAPSGGSTGGGTTSETVNINPGFGGGGPSYSPPAQSVAGAVCAPRPKECRGCEVPGEGHGKPRG